MQTVKSLLAPSPQTTSVRNTALARTSLPPLQLVSAYRHHIAMIEQLIREKSGARPLRILEAGCGAKWPHKLEGTKYRLTAVDIDEEALEVRKTKVRDVDEVLVGDLRTSNLFPSCSFDVVYNSYVLEHVDGAERVLDNFINWLAPGGLLILKIPDRASVYGYLARLTPLWVHVFVYRYIFGSPRKPGHGPFPTYYDPVVSRTGIHSYCVQHGCRIKYEAGHTDYFPRGRLSGVVARAVARSIAALSFGRLDWRYNNLTLVIENAGSDDRRRAESLTSRDGRSGR